VGSFQKPLRFGPWRSMAVNRTFPDKSENHGVPGSNPGPATIDLRPGGRGVDLRRDGRADARHLRVPQAPPRGPRREDRGRRVRGPLAYQQMLQFVLGRSARRGEAGDYCPFPRCRCTSGITASANSSMELITSRWSDPRKCIRAIR
jgi:hypothetical protein